MLNPTSCGCPSESSGTFRGASPTTQFNTNCGKTGTPWLWHVRCDLPRCAGVSVQSTRARSLDRATCCAACKSRPHAFLFCKHGRHGALILYCVFAVSDHFNKMQNTATSHHSIWTRRGAGQHHTAGAHCSFVLPRVSRCFNVHLPQPPPALAPCGTVPRGRTRTAHSRYGAPARVVCLCLPCSPLICPLSFPLTPSTLLASLCDASTWYNRKRWVRCMGSRSMVPLSCLYERTVWLLSSEMVRSPKGLKC